jgi:chemotaxis protein methyltransferase CheR
MAAIENFDSIKFDDFDFLRNQLKEIAGIQLSDNKIDLVAGRLRRHIYGLGMSSFSQYVSYLTRLHANHDEWMYFINCLTTNKTDFFREIEHFNYLSQKIVPLWQKPGGLPVRIWSAACSSGEEPYSLAMLLLELKKSFDFEFLIQATDIDTKVLSIAANGVYKRSCLTNVPMHLYQNHITAGTGAIHDWIKIKREVKRWVTFKRCNLAQTPYLTPYSFDIIFCRNVLIYFSRNTIEKVINGLYQAASSGAYLFIGHTESLQQIKHPWHYVKPSIYRKLEK